MSHTGRCTRVVKPRTILDKYYQQQKLIITGDIAGIYWVSTLEKYRNQGFAEAITWQSIMLGKVKGCRFASLQASKLGAPVYKALGKNKIPKSSLTWKAINIYGPAF